MRTPLVSVVMPVYNREVFLEEAIQSILQQTFRDFEFIIVDDGSTNPIPVKIIKSFADPRIRLIQLPENRGISAASNAGIAEARGEFIAMMDSDEYAMPQRLATQVPYMQANPQIGICGSSVQWLDAEGKPLWISPATTQSAHCHAQLVLAMPFFHTTWLVRRKIYDFVNYRTEWDLAPDLDFIVEAANITIFGGIHVPLMKRRDHPSRVTHLRRKEQNDQTLLITKRFIDRIGACWNQDRVEEWYCFGREVSGSPKRGADIFVSLTELVRQLLVANMQTRYVDQRALQQVVALRWWSLCRDAAGQGTAIFRLYRESPARWAGWSRLAHEGRMLSLCLGIGRDISLVRLMKRHEMDH